ncbi:medium-chain acyl-CoA ligase ACSF2, mitochondrial isoform X2 [Diceros bicornis minor]|uniref:medium-chain acyl-CoA ligase ACSF2, mitochondrial isoform X2 n=1 Tax=Diceros bicornis minor TaxID=77932 RepID=UPI0026F364A9|nr:medium-chain acyl-CoA ligase ACSF2, mitochondrial isoform X2 [Diceros bicornis minor]
MAVCVGMLRLGRLCAGSPGVLGPRAVLSRGWQEARWQGVRPLSSVEADHTAPLPIGGCSYIQGGTRLHLINETIGRCLDATAQKFPDREALVVLHDNVRKTFAQLKEEVDKAASGLLNIGLCKGDRLGMWGPNSYAWVLMQLASAQAGIILVSVNPAYQSMELEYALKKGTTGRPKGATLSHYNIVNNANMIGARLRLQLKEPKELRMVLPTPLYHCLGSVGGTMVSVIYGVTLILPSPGFDGKKALEAISRERSSFLYGTPTMFVDILNQPDFSSYDISTMCGGVIAGSPAPPELIRAIINKLNMKELVVAYGTTENSPVTFMNFAEDTVEQKAESVGRVMPHTEAQIVSTETGTLTKLNTPGELWIRGYCVMLGYWGDPQKTEEAVGQDKWYRTGDIATMNEQGFCKIVGRSKDMIIRGGENIYPAELEDFFHTHPQVQEVQVVGVKDKRLGEEICACIRLKKGEKTTPEEIRAFCKGKIAHFKIPRYIVFVTEYPLTVSGKIQKFKLREQMEQHLNL